MFKKVLVTGGARGIGAEITKIFAENGYFVYIHCNESIGEAEEILKKYGNGEIIRADLSDKNGINILAEKAKDADIIINNAGISLVAPFDAATEAELDSLYNVNLFAPLAITRAAIPTMISKKSGCIINISSVFGEKGGSCEVDYSVTKSALIGFTKALAKELGPSGIRVNCICPGVIDTDMNDNLTFEDVESLTEEIPLCRMGKAKEIAESVYFLATEKASYITGAVLDINGGWD